MRKILLVCLLFATDASFARGGGHGGHSSSHSSSHSSGHIASTGSEHTTSSFYAANRFPLFSSRSSGSSSGGSQPSEAKCDDNAKWYQFTTKRCK